MRLAIDRTYGFAPPGAPSPVRRDPIAGMAGADDCEPLEDIDAAVYGE